MNTLFDLAPSFPSGYHYHPDFINPDEEKELLAAIAAIELLPMQFQGYEAKRKTASFGYDWSFEKRILSKGKDIPAAFAGLIKKITAHLSLRPEEIAELLVTEYPVGAVINWHRDAPPFDLIAGISLLSDCTFRLRPQEKTKQNRSSIISFPVRKRSLYIMQGEARSEWQHSIAPVKKIRFSITIRTLKNQRG